jgi:hypothetical protein
MGLTPGVAYDIRYLRFVGWRNEAGAIQGTLDGYSCWAYFDADDRYLGPDKDGVIPIFERLDTPEER